MNNFRYKLQEVIKRLSDIVRRDLGHRVTVSNWYTLRTTTWYPIVQISTSLGNRISSCIELGMKNESN